MEKLIYSDPGSYRTLLGPSVSLSKPKLHYDGYKVLEFIESASLPFLEGNVVKYVCRHSKKDGVKDINKAIDYLNQIKRLRYPNG